LLEKIIEKRFGELKNSPYLCDMKTMREKLINAIFDMVSDEIENVSEAKKYAAMSDEQLVDEVINIAEYYRRQANEN
jgi:glycyl-tRNA synthetase beta subunit